MSDPRCEAHRERVSAFVDERLAGPELLLLEEHLEACAACRRFEAGVRRVRELLQASEAIRPLLLPPPGFAAAVAARAAREPGAKVVPFTAGRARRPYAAWAGFAAAAAAGVLFFAWSWQRLLPGEDPAQRLARTAEPAAITLAVADENSMDVWLREHASLARGATLLGPAEEVEFAGFAAPLAAER